ncbi:calnexin-like [Acipenser ruthenus]|uniref:calnexin-like n=1 Tax=Acipenser ruthenus TaxID=7906 RepID=UPI00274101AC|nr:calnexin-like [Acipenser ruthenus]
MMYVLSLLVLSCTSVYSQETFGGAYKPPQPAGGLHFSESFHSSTIEDSKWVTSKARKKDDDDNEVKYDGLWALEEPVEQKLPGDKGLVLKSRARLHAIAAPLDRVFHFHDQPLIVQYEVTFQKGIDCGGAYIKLLSHSNQLDLTQFHDTTPFSIMFGPDKCGEDDKLHFIFRHRNPVTGLYEEKHAKKPDVDLRDYYTDHKPHLYTLYLHPDNNYEILIDQSVVSKGSLLKDMTPPVTPPREIEDPADTKPNEWDDRIHIPDPTVQKPHDWDEDAPPQIPDPMAVRPPGWLAEEQPFIPDPDSEKPDDWEEEMDGEWEAPKIPNPACKDAVGCGKWTPPLVSNPAHKGKWKPPVIANPNYQGVWKARVIPNPGYFEDPHPFRMDPIGAVGLELWSLTPDLLFDNFLVCSEKSLADRWTAESWGQKQAAYDADAPGVVLKLFAATEKRPWLWGVYVFTVALPVVLIISFCWPDKRFGPPDQDYFYKKTDDPQLDDSVDPEEGSKSSAQGTKAMGSKDNNGTKTDDIKRPSKADLEVKDQVQSRRGRS